MGGEKILCVYPSWGVNGVQRFVKDLYEGLRDVYNVKLVGLWFDSKLEVRDENFEIVHMIDAEKDEYRGKEEVKRKFKELVDKYEPNIIHLNTFGIDKDILRSIYDYKDLHNKSARIVYTVHSLSFQDFSRNPTYCGLFGISSEEDKFVRELVEISGDIFTTLNSEQKKKRLINLLNKYNLSTSKERIDTLDIVSYLIALQTSVIRISDIVVFVSKFLRESAYKNQYFNQLVEGKERIITNGTKMYEIYERNRDWIRDKVRRWKEKCGFQNKFIVGYFGRIVESKGVMDLMEVVEDILKEGYRDLVLILGGPISKETENRIYKRFGELMGKNIFLFKSEQLPTPLSPIADIEVALIHSCFDSEVYPSYYETFGLVPIEAVSCETPVIVRRVDNLVEFEKEGIAEGFSSKEELKSLILQHMKRGKKEGVEEKREIIKEKYGIERMRRDYINLFDEIRGKINLPYTILA